MARWVREHFRVHSTDSGMTALLHRMGYCYKKPKLLPGKTPRSRGAGRLRRALQKAQGAQRRAGCHPVHGRHPQHNPVLGGGWIKRGRGFPIKSNTGGRRLNINGVIDIDTLHAVIRYDDTIDAESSIALLSRIEAAYSKAATIPVFCDNARYYRSETARTYLEHVGIDLQFLPPYAPNLNLIDRFWEFFKRRVLYNRYYKAFSEHKAACKQFCVDLNAHAEQLCSLLTDQLEIIHEH